MTVSEAFASLTDYQKAIVYLYIGNAYNHKNDNNFPVTVAVLFEKEFEKMTKEQQIAVDFIVRVSLEEILRGVL